MESMTLSIKAEGMAGNSIQETAADMLALADRTGCRVRVQFNDVALCMRPGGSPDQLVREYHKACELKGLQPRMAFG